MLLNITRWPALLVFCLAGLAAACFAFVSVNLFTQAMGSIRFLREHGLVAIRHGALLQIAQLVLLGGLTLGAWLVFKVCEHDLEDRYLVWARAQRRKARAARRGR